MKDFTESITTVMDGLGAQPIIGTSISLVSASFGMLLNTTGYIDTGIPDGVKDMFQMIAWACTITVSLLTIIGWVKKNSFIKPKKHGRRKNNC